jgi:hypothetical protein
MVISEMERGELGGRDGAAVLGITLRHLRRVVAAYREDGVVALAHGNRGRKPVNAIGEAIRQRVVDLAGSTYGGFNQQHFTELLAEREGIALVGTQHSTWIGDKESTQAEAAEAPQPERALCKRRHATANRWKSS